MHHVDENVLRLFLTGGDFLPSLFLSFQSWRNLSILFAICGLIYPFRRLVLFVRVLFFILSLSSFLFAAQMRSEFRALVLTAVQEVKIVESYVSNAKSLETLPINSVLQIRASKEISGENWLYVRTEKNQTGWLRASEVKEFENESY